MLRSFGKTADEWGELPAEVRAFHELAHNEHQRRKQDRQDDLRDRVG